VTHSRKSIKHRALSAAHRAAKEANQLAEFYAMRDAQRGVVPASAALPPAPQSPFDNYDSIRTPEGASWPEDGRHVPYMRWRLPFNSAR
jgi:hypothetical protein